VSKESNIINTVKAQGLKPSTNATTKTNIGKGSPFAKFSTTLEGVVMARTNPEIIDKVIKPTTQYLGSKDVLSLSTRYEIR